MKTFFRVFSIILLVCWMGLIFYFSHQTAEKSSNVSGEVIEKVTEVVYPDFKEMPEEEKEEVIVSLQGIVRSMAHYLIFGGLGFFAYLTFISYVKLEYKIRVFLMLITSLLYAVCDEFHQSFIPGRSFQLIDIAVDFGGALTAVLVCILFVLAVKPLREKVKYKNPKSFKIPTDYDFNYKEYKYSLEYEENEQEETVVVTEDLTDIVENTVESKPEEKPLLSEEFEYASSIIGKTVVEATKVCNELSVQDNQDKVDLVNLVLGRTEVLKGEILKILNTDNTFEAKKDLMQKEQMSAYDYFDSIKAQI